MFHIRLRYRRDAHREITAEFLPIATILHASSMVRVGTNRPENWKVFTFQSLFLRHLEYK